MLEICLCKLRYLLFKLALFRSVEQQLRLQRTHLMVASIALEAGAVG